MVGLSLLMIHEDVSWWILLTVQAYPGSSSVRISALQSLQRLDSGLALGYSTMSMGLACLNTTPTVLTRGLEIWSPAWRGLLYRPGYRSQYYHIWTQSSKADCHEQCCCKDLGMIPWGFFIYVLVWLVMVWLCKSAQCSRGLHFHYNRVPAWSCVFNL